MNLNQVLMVVFALTMLGMLQLSINASILQSIATSLDSGARIEALMIGRAMIDEIVNKNFDRVTAARTVVRRTDLTLPANFGPSVTDAVPQPDSAALAKTIFKNVDDYHLYRRVVMTANFGAFLVRDSVIYVEEANLDKPSAAPTWYKKIIVTVNHANLLQPVVVQSLAVYPRYF